MTLTDISNAARAAKADLERINMMATELAELLEGRLRHVNRTMPLITLKKELRKFNIHTGTWRD
jgi:hypothetical protein